MKKIAIIPARGGSKRIPHKNIREFCGKPIIAYSIEAALQSHLFDEVMVSTDDEEIAMVARKYGANVPFMRTAETANDYATTASVLIEVLDCYKAIGKSFDVACCLYSTAPFVTSQRLIEAFDLMQSKNYYSVFTTVAFSFPVQRGLKINDGKVSMVWPEYKQTRSQDLSPIYHDAGQLYFFDVERFYEEGALWGDNTGALILPELEVRDVDTDTDWKLAEMQYKFLHQKD